MKIRNLHTCSYTKLSKSHPGSNLNTYIVNKHTVVEKKSKRYRQKTIDFDLKVYST